MRILFSCMGTSDPVRGNRDGPLMHILRHYRPEKLCVFLSGEVSRRNQSDERIAKTMRFIKENWDGYSPALDMIRTNIDDPSDMDAVSKPISEAVHKHRTNHPQDEILLNLSSGTPQMKIVLALLASDICLKAKGIQVKNPVSASGSTERTNSKKYNVYNELKNNKDERLSAKNRCTEPELTHIQRQRAKEQILALLKQRDYAAIREMKDYMPDDLFAIVEHLYYRDRLQSEKAKDKAKQLNLPFSLYPMKSGESRSDYGEISEAYLVLLNRCHRQQYEELILRLTPLIIRLGVQILKNTEKMDDIIDFSKPSAPYFSSERLEKSLPDVYNKVNKQFDCNLQSGNLSVALCYHLLQHTPGIKKKYRNIFYCLNDLNSECRNVLAHQLTPVTAEQITNVCKMKPDVLLDTVGKLIASIYPECDTNLFTIYKDCGEYIEKNLI